jgi:hypothetical protein
MAVNAPKPSSSRRKPVAVPPANDVKDNLQLVDPNGTFKFTLRMPMEMAVEFKMEAARRMISLQELFHLSFDAYKEKQGQG